MANAPYFVYGMITSKGNRTESQPFDATYNDGEYYHYLPGAKGDGVALRCFGWIRAGEVVVTENIHTEGEE